MTLLAMLMALLAARYIPANPDDYFPEQRTVYEDNTFVILGHIFGAAVAMMLGPFQFLPAQRRRLIGLHRWMGRLYLAGVAVGSAFGFYMAWLAYGGVISLRIWLIMLSEVAGIDFINAYRVVAWLCWVPNLLIAQTMVGQQLPDRQTIAAHVP